MMVNVCSVCVCVCACTLKTAAGEGCADRAWCMCVGCATAELCSVLCCAGVLLCMSASRCVRTMIWLQLFCHLGKLLVMNQVLSAGSVQQLTERMCVTSSVMVIADRLICCCEAICPSMMPMVVVSMCLSIEMGTCSHTASHTAYLPILCCMC